jgi:Tol biopolymer transport system component
LQLNPGLPPRLEEIIHKALEKDRDLRYQHASEIRGDLKRLKRDTDSGRAVAAMSSSPPAAGTRLGPAAVGTPPLQADSSDSQMFAGLVKRHKKAFMALMAGGIVIAAAILYALYRASSHAPAPPAALEFTRVTGSGDVQEADISPDGKYVAYVRETEGKQSLWLKQLATGSDVQSATLGEDVCPGVAFSPDGSYVYFTRKDRLKPSGDLYQLPSLGGTPRRMLTGISGPPAISPDGQRLAFVRDTPNEDSLLTASLDGSGERVLASYKRPAVITHPRVAWSPDGNALAFIYHKWGSVLSTVPAEGGPVQPLAVAHLEGIFDVTWLPGGRHLLVVAFGGQATTQLYEASLDGGEARQITHDLLRYQEVRASADAMTLLALQSQPLVAIQATTPGNESDARPLSAGNQSVDGARGLAWTPEGKIVYSSVPSPHAEIWETGADGSNPHPLINDASADNFFPAVSLHSEFIAFVSAPRTKNVTYNILRMDMEGRNLKQLTQGKVDLHPAISPDGQWVIFERSEGGKVVLMKVPSEGGSAAQLTDHNALWPTVSPDGKWIACIYLPAGNQPASLAVLPFAGGQPAKVFPLPATASTERPIHWTPDGRAISFINSVHGVRNIWEQPVVGGPAKAVTHFTSDQIFWFDWSPDGRLALSRGTVPTDAVLIKNYQ